MHKNLTIVWVAASLTVAAFRVAGQITPPFNVTASVAILNTNGANLLGTNPSAPLTNCPTVTNVAGCLVQIIGVGANNAADLPNLDGSIGGDDTLLLTTFIGVGINPCHQQDGRFVDSLTASDGTKMYGRVFNARTLATATHWGQSAVFTVAGATVLDVSQLGLKRTAMPKGSNPNTTDTDGDGQTDFQELVANTNPLDVGDFLAVAGLSGTSGFSVLGRAGRNYYLQRTTNSLSNATIWGDIYTNGVLTVDSNLILNDPSPPNSPKAFYRIKVSMP